MLSSQNSDMNKDISGTGESPYTNLNSQHKGKGDRISTANELDPSFRVPKYGAKFHQNRARTATVVEWTDRRDKLE